LRAIRAIVGLGHCFVRQERHVASRVNLTGFDFFEDRLITWKDLLAFASIPRPRGSRYRLAKGNVTRQSHQPEE